MLISRIGVAVMTGGQSSRMGTDKAGLMFNARETFLQKICGRMSFFPERYLSVNAERSYEVQDFVPVVDEISGAGPAGGFSLFSGEVKRRPCCFLHATCRALPGMKHTD